MLYSIARTLYHAVLSFDRVRGRIKYERYIPGLRILFFSIPSRNCVFITGIHERGTLGAGMDYDFFRDAFVRAQGYWALREQQC